jgi:hypothetical protein
MPSKSSLGTNKTNSAKKEVEVGPKRISIWPEWTEAEIAAEKFVRSKYH